MEIFVVTSHSINWSGVVYAGVNEDVARDVDKLESKFNHGEDYEDGGVSMLTLEIWVDDVPQTDRVEVMYLSDKVWRKPPPPIMLQSD